MKNAGTIVVADDIQANIDLLKGLLVREVIRFTLRPTGTLLSRSSSANSGTALAASKRDVCKRHFVCRRNFRRPEEVISPPCDGSVGDTIVLNMPRTC